MVLTQHFTHDLMATLFYSHADFLLHDTGIGHPECADRLRAIHTRLEKPEFSKLIKKDAPLNEATKQQIALIHPPPYYEAMLNAMPIQDYRFIDSDTVLSPGSRNAALRAVAAVCDAVDNICGKHLADNAFCALRPPGHHATPEQAMGFCLFNNIAIAAQYAWTQYHLQRVAIVDFDVHHGNGTQQAFYQQQHVLYASSHEMPNYPGTGAATETGVGNIINVPLAAGCGGDEFRQKYRDIIFPAIRRFKPELLLISAGFDAHKNDPLASINLLEEDYHWLTRELVTIANDNCHGWVISSLEGGYHLEALSNSVAAHVRALMEL